MQPLGRLDQRTFLRPRQKQFQHDIVGQENIWWCSNDAALLLVGLLSSVTGESYWSLVVGITMTEKLFEFPMLTIGQSVHRIDNQWRQVEEDHIV